MRQLKLLALGFVSLVLLPGLLGGVAEAHVLKQDNGMSGVLHVPPNDDPVAGEQTKLYVSFANKPATFSLTDCDCAFTIKQQGKVLQSNEPIPALTGATLQGYSTVVFPRIGIYDVVVTGRAKDGAFEPFTLNYTLRVARGTGTASMNVANKQTYGSTALIVGVGVFLVAAIIGYSVIDTTQNKPALASVKTTTKRPVKRKK